jgi:hypothetical protein
MLLCECVVEQAVLYYHSHFVLPNIANVSDCEAVDAGKAIDGAIKHMFDSDFFTSKQLARLYRRLHTELWPNLPLQNVSKRHMSAQNDDIHARVRDELADKVKALISMRSDTTYERQLTERRELAREFTVHPDLTPAIR